MKIELYFMLDWDFCTVKKKRNALWTLNTVLENFEPMIGNSYTVEENLNAQKSVSYGDSFGFWLLEKQELYKNTCFSFFFCWCKKIQQQGHLKIRQLIYKLMSCVRNCNFSIFFDWSFFWKYSFWKYKFNSEVHLEKTLSCKKVWKVLFKRKWIMSLSEIEYKIIESMNLNNSRIDVRVLCL